MKPLKIFIIIFTIFVVLSCIGAFVALYVTLVKKKSDTLAQKEQQESDAIKKMKESNTKQPLNSISFENGYTMAVLK